MAIFGEKQILQLVADIQRHNDLYYTEGKSVISDAEYDTLKDRLRQLDPENAILKSVGAVSTGTNKFTHSSLVGSLNSVKDVDGMKAWFTSAQTKEPFYSVVAEPKMDGLTIVLNYKDGILVSGATRGDGKVGENIFISFKTGVLYKHHDETVDAAYFYGVAYDSYVWLIFNEYPDLVKTFLTISEISNDPWAAPDETGILKASDSIEHEDVNNYDRFKADMTSRLKEGQFRPRNGEWRAEFLRDAKTTTGAFYVPDLLNGRVLTGNNILIKLKNDCTDAVNLRSVTVNSVPSR